MELSTDKMYVVNTPGDDVYNYAWLVPHRQVWRFTVRACQEVRIALTELVQNTTWHAYEVRIGAEGNTKVQILTGIFVTCIF